MATSVATFHGHDAHPSLWEQARQFFADLVADLKSTSKQFQGLTKTDLFHDHINALAISYFGLILLLLIGSLPILAYLVKY
jgi:hypothetical protein